MRLYLFVQSFFILAIILQPSPAQCQETPVAHRIETSANRAFVYYVDGKPGADITKNIQQAVDEARANHGGSVVLPPGRYQMTDTVYLAGSIDRFPKGGAKGIDVTGSGGAEGTQISYRGPEGSVVFDLSAPWGCSLRNLSIDADNTPGVIGIWYHGGYDRGTNGGKNNMFENIILRRMDVGIHIGDPFGPDLVGSTFRNIWISYMRVGVQIEGANVTGMAFYNLSGSTWNEAGIKIIGHTARRLRASPDDEIPEPEVPGVPAVVTDANTGKELFQDDVPEYALKHRTFTGTFRGYGPWVWVGGGAPDITIYNLNMHGADPSSWLIDNNWGHVRVYSARIEGPAGIYRRTAGGPAGRFADVLVDVNATSPGGLMGNVIEYHGQGPLYLIGGVYEGNIALADTTVYSMGVKFFEWRESTSGMIRKDYLIPEGSKAVRTGKDRIFPGRRGMYDIVDIPLPRDISFVQLPGTEGMQIHEMTPQATLSVDVTKGQSSVTVPLGGMAAQPDGNYQVYVTPGFDAGGAWVTKKRNDSVTVNFSRAPADASRADILIQRAPFRTQNMISPRFEKDE